MWPFTRKPKPINPGPINEDWAYGDLAESLADDWHNQSGLSVGIQKGDVFKVLSVEPRSTWFGDEWCLELGGHAGRFFRAGGFRKVPPLNSAADEQFTASIRALQPVKHGEPVA